MFLCLFLAASRSRDIDDLIRKVKSLQEETTYLSMLILQEGQISKEAISTIPKNKWAQSVSHNMGCVTHSSKQKGHATQSMNYNTTYYQQHQTTQFSSRPIPLRHQRSCGAKSMSYNTAYYQQHQNAISSGPVQDSFIILAPRYNRHLIVPKPSSHDIVVQPAGRNTAYYQQA